MGSQGISIDPPRVPDHDVIVVGFGPVGAVLAGLLARRGLDVLAVERDTDIFNLPRAAHLDSEVMRILQELGCADTIAPSLIANEGMDFLTADRQVLLRMRSTEPTPSGWPSSNFFHQPGVERAIRAAAIDAYLRRRDGRPVQYNRPRPHIEQGLIGGAPAALDWLEGQLRGHRLPVAHLGLTPADPAWTLLPESDRAALGGHPGVNVRHADGEVLALLVVNPRTRQVERAEGDAFHLERLTRDVTRALGTLAG